MTIAACYPCLEGVVFGADSTTTIFVPGPPGQVGREHHYTFCQKLFEFGEVGASTGIVIWGMGSIGTVSYRTLIAEVADRAKQQNLPTLGDVSCLWSEMFWAEYTGAYQQLLVRARALQRKGENCTESEKEELNWLERSLSGGVCLGGRWGSVRRPEAYEISFNPFLMGNPAPQALTIGTARFWGCENLIRRVVLGIDPGLYGAILSSDKWTGTSEDLFDLVRRGILAGPLDLPIREAIDFIYAEVYTTIKAMKFSHLAPICGGPIEIGLITTDRPFRWVCHKKLSKA
ncbi:MAG: hypothetical protein ACYTEO_18285, partial [Planctomycetota bacterium]